MKNEVTTAASAELAGSQAAPFASARLGLARVSLDGRFLEVNDGLCTLLGVGRDHLLGRHFADFTHPKDLQPSLQRLKEAASQGSEFLSFRKRYVRKDGGVVSATVNVCVVPPAGVAEGYLLTVIEPWPTLTPQYHMVDALLGSTRDLFYVTDAAGRIVYANRALVERVDGVGPGWHLRDLARRDPLFEAIQEHVTLVVSTARPVRAASRALSLHGARVYQHALQPLGGVDGGLAFVAGSARDITEAQRENELAALEHRVARCLAGAADANEALQGVMCVVCETQGWQCGRYFAADPATGTLRFDQGWVAEGSPLAGYLARSQGITMRAGRGLAGMAWKSGEAIWCPDTSIDSRVQEKMLDCEFGLHGAFVFPVGTRSAKLGVLSFSSRSVREPDVRLLAAAEVIGEQLTQFLLRRREESEARRRGELLRMAGTVAHFGGWAVPLPAQRVLWSDEVCAIHEMPVGYSPTVEEGIAFYAPEHREAIRAAFEDCVARGMPFDMELEILTAKGRRVWVRAVGEAVRDGKGSIVAVQGAFQDISRRKRTERDLAVAEERFRLLAKATNDIIWDWDVAAGRVWVSSSLDVPNGATVDTAQPVAAYVELIHPEDRERVVAKIGAALEGAQDQWADEYRMRLCDGCYRFVAGRGYVIRDHTGRPLRVVGGMTDVSERKRAEAHVRESREKVSRILESISDALFVLDPQWRFAYVNPRATQLLQRSAEDLIGRNVWQEFPEAVGSRFQQEYERAVCEGAPARFEEYYAPLARWFHISAFPSPEGLSVYFRDISDRKRDEAALRKRVLQQTLVASFSEKALSGASVTELLREISAVIRDGLGVTLSGFSAPALQVGDPADPFGWLVTYVRAKAEIDPEDESFLRSLANCLHAAARRKDSEEKLAYLAHFDTLTNLPNRSLFEERLRQLVALSDRLREPPAAARDRRRLAVVVLNLKRFRAVNDALGRQAGDALLKAVCGRMRDRAGDTNMIARLGADHFALLIPARDSEQELVHEMEAWLQKLCGEPYLLEDQEVRITAELGISMFPDDATDGEVLLRNAEAALQKAKQRGEPYAFYEQKMMARVAENLALESKLRKAIEREEFVLHYQPKVTLRTRKVAGVEALIRWNSPELGLVPPARFIPLLEETGLILEVGAWALRRAALDHRKWKESGIDAPPIAVNVSAMQLRQRDFVETVEAALAGGTSPADVEIELTESLLMDDVARNIAKLKALRALGINIAIDDFGTGYSSLAYLAKLPVQSLKIDRSFISAMHDDPNAMTLVSTIISLAHSLGLKVVAEGVETEEQANMLRLLRCDEKQGYLFSKPLPEADLVALLRRQAQALPADVGSARSIVTGQPS